MKVMNLEQVDSWGLQTGQSLLDHGCAGRQITPYWSLRGNEQPFAVRKLLHQLTDDKLGVPVSPGRVDHLATQIRQLTQDFATRGNILRRRHTVLVGADSDDRKLLASRWNDFGDGCE